MPAFFSSSFGLVIPAEVFGGRAGAMQSASRIWWGRLGIFPFVDIAILRKQHLPSQNKETKITKGEMCLGQGEERSPGGDYRADLSAIALAKAGAAANAASPEQAGERANEAANSVVIGPGSE